ncbi:MAG: virulence factor SrfB [Pseudomonadota bacterium]
MKQTINAFPDSGWYTVFYNLKKDVTESEWTSPIGKPWLKGRFGSKTTLDTDGNSIVEKGFWVAVDLTVGKVSRGYSVADSVAQAGPQSGSKIVSDDLEPEGGKTKGYTSLNPYIASSLNELPEQISLQIQKEFELEKKHGDLTLNVNFLEEAGDPVKVNLIVDFGNSRTVVLALEQTGFQHGLASACRPIVFPKPGTDLDSVDLDSLDLDDAIPDSWFALMEGIFKPEPTRVLTETAPARFKPDTILGKIVQATGRERNRKAHKAPHQFANVSPAIIGYAAKEALSDIATDVGGISFLSSPKMYVWDDAPLGVNGRPHWTMQLQPWRRSEDDAASVVPLKGTISRFLPNGATKWSLENRDADLDEAVERRADYSRADSLIWVALSILEQAHAQINSEAWRKGNQIYLRRMLGDIILSYPAGWTKDEIEIFREKWEIARDIFLLSRYAAPKEIKASGDAPRIRLALDEAVAPQLAIVFSEMHHMGDAGENWIELIGKGTGSDAKVRVMTLDIGGGTTDTSVIEYSDELPGAGVDLVCKLLFKDSTTIAGDQLAKDIIERVLLPKLGESFAEDAAGRETFEQFFLRQVKRDSDRQQRLVCTRTVFIPIALEILRQVSRGESAIEVDLSETGAAAKQIDLLNELGRKEGLDIDLIDTRKKLKFDTDKVDEVITDWFTHIAEGHARYVGLFDCDLVILTGKPSELPQAKRILAQSLPLDPARIISAKGYYAGDWLPISDEGVIEDAKLVTALGTVVFNAVESGMVPGWRIRSFVDDAYCLQNHWGRISGSLKPFAEEDLILPAGADEGETRMMTESFIGRSRFLNHMLPERVYKLVLKSGAKTTVDLQLKRAMPRAANDEYGIAAEGLEILSAKDAKTGKSIPLEEIQLKLCSIPLSGEHWQESGRFEVRWSA